VDPDGAAIDRLVRRTLDVSATQRFADMPYRLALL
jgi:hypothetical protein